MDVSCVSHALIVRGRDGRNDRGNGRGHDSQKSRSKARGKSRSKSCGRNANVTCHHCGKKGHIRPQYHELRNEKRKEKGKEKV